jgi:cell division protein FtsN
MKIRTFIVFITLVACICSCNTSRKGSKSTSPYLTEENPKPEITVIEEKVKVVGPAGDPLYRYYVIIGSFKVVGNARQYQAELIKEGFSPVILENENGLFRVSAGAFNDEAAARSRIIRIRADNAQHEDVWLLVRK